MKSFIKNCYDFIGKKSFIYGSMGLLGGFILFGFDLALAIMLQRFFMANGLISIGATMPLGIKLETPLIEGVILVFIAVFRATMIWGNGFLAGLCQTNVEVEKRNSLVQWAITNGGQETGQMMTYFNDLTIGTAAAISGIFYLISRIIMLIAIFVTMVFYSAPLAFFVVALIFLFAPLQMAIDKIITKNSSLIQSSLAKAVMLFSRSVKNNLFLSLHNIAKDEIKNIEKAVYDYGHSTISYFSLSSFRSALPQILGFIAVVVIAIQGGVYFNDNPALLVAFLYMVLRFFQVLSDMVRISANLRLNYPRVSILYDWWDKNIDKSAAPYFNSSKPDKTGLIGWSAKNISFLWPNGNITAINNLNFDINPGSITLIVGSSGSGKTTLFQILLGILKPTRGYIFFTDEAGHEMQMQGPLPYCISYVGPDPFLVAGSVRDQLLIGNKGLNDDEFIAALRLVQADFVFDFAEGLDHLLTEQGIGLSAGQKQRLALARAILRKPSVLLLDEATANLDETTEGLIIKLVNSLRGKMTILVVSHRPHPDLIVDRLIDLNSESKI